MKKCLLFGIAFLTNIANADWFNDRQVTQYPADIIMDFDSLNARFIGNWPFGHAYTVSYDTLRNLCFVGSGGGIYILDASNPSNPLYISELHTRGLIKDLFYDATMDRLYAACGTGGLEILDLTNPNLPQKLGCSFIPNNAYGIYVIYPYAYIADGDSGLRVFNILDPNNPQELGHLNMLAFAYDIYVKDTALLPSILDIKGLDIC
jgi:hypothetical protein